MYAIVKTGGKQYRVQEGQTLLIERLRDAEGADVTLPTLLIVDGETLLDGDKLAGKGVAATIVAHERGPKLRVVKFKPKRGFKRRNGHRQELTKIQIKSIGAATKPKAAAKPAAATKAKAAPKAAASPKAQEATSGA
jgi:large subunit ribosomal protein L21